MLVQVVVFVVLELTFVLFGTCQLTGGVFEQLAVFVVLELTFVLWYLSVN